MSQHTANTPHDSTVIQFAGNGAAKEAELPFTAVAVAPGRQAPRHTPYLAQQTSFDQYTPGLNPLVNAASHLLLEIIQLKTLREANLEALRARLEAEVRGFNAQASALGVSEAQVNAAQYLLCTALDEGVTTSSIPDAHGEWQHRSLLSTFHKDTWGGEIFFDVLSRAMEQPASRLYLLELIYLLLSLGFEGKFRLQDRGPLALELLRDQVYRQIRLLRGEPSPDLAPKIAAKKFQNKIYAYVPLWLVGCMVAFCLVVTFWGFSFILDGKSSPLLTQFQRHAPTGTPYVFAITEAKPAAPPSTQPDAAEQVKPEAKPAPESADAATEVRP